MDQPDIIRTADEAQRAHDMLIQLLLDDDLRKRILGPESVDPEGLIVASIRANADVLCWLLGHQHNTTFETNLEGVERMLRKLGIEIIDLGGLQWPM